MNLTTENLDRYGLMFVSPPKSYAGILIPNVTVLGNEAFVGDEIMSVEPL